MAKRFPLLGGGGSVPWALAAEAYKHYGKRHGDQSLERLAERGGFALQELACHLEGHDPGRAMQHEACVNKLVHRLTGDEAFLTPGQAKELFKQFAMAMIHAPHSHSCPARASEATCECWRDKAVGVYEKYADRLST